MGKCDDDDDELLVLLLLLLELLLLLLLVSLTLSLSLLSVTCVDDDEDEEDEDELKLVTWLLHDWSQLPSHTFGRQCSTSLSDDDDDDDDDEDDNELLVGSNFTPRTASSNHKQTFSSCLGTSWHKHSSALDELYDAVQKSSNNDELRNDDNVVDSLECELLKPGSKLLAVLEKKSIGRRELVESTLCDDNDTVSKTSLELTVLKP